jgi:hypothetical protein
VADLFMKTQTRRHLLVNAGRYAVLGLVAFLTGGLLIKRRRLLRESNCVNRGICGGCQLSADCKLPQALSRKQVLVRFSHDKNKGICK